MIRVYEVKLAVDEELGLLKEKIAKKLRISPLQIIDCRVFKESIDARKKNEVFFVYIVDVHVKDEAKVLRRNKNLQKSPHFSYQEAKPGDKIFEPPAHSYWNRSCGHLCRTSFNSKRL